MCDAVEWRCGGGLAEDLVGVIDRDDREPRRAVYLRHAWFGVVDSGRVCLYCSHKKTKYSKTLMI